MKPSENIPHISNRITVMLATEGTFPFHQGGVSTWCNILVKKLIEINYIIYSIVMNPFVLIKFQLPPSAKLIKVPLWGTEEPSEHLIEIPFSKVYENKRRTTPEIIKKQFLPLFEELIKEIFIEEKNPKNLASTINELYQYFQSYDYKLSFKSEEAWEVFKQNVNNFVENSGGRLAVPTIFDLTQSLGWVYRFLVILNTPVPKTDVAHSAAAAFCGIPCMLAKMNYKTPFLLTEHGVYMREQYLAASRRGLSSYLKNFLINLITSVAFLNYEFADQVSPVCAYNTRWEREFGVKPEKIEVIYNGVDPEIFTPEHEPKPRYHPTVVAVARVDPVKDLLMLLHAAAFVKEQIPDVRFIIYGSITVPEYYQECIALRNSLGLDDIFIFAGHTDDVPSAYHSGDVVALSSITEAFPYSVIEAMMCGKPVVATDVGGVKEALGNCGIVIRPRQPEEMANALIRLLQDEQLRTSMGEDARQRALTYFTIDRAVNLYLESYLKLYRRQAAVLPLPRRRARQMLLAQRAYAFYIAGMWKEAIEQFKLAIQVDMVNPAVPVFLAEIAQAYNQMGEHHLALNELEKAKAMVVLLEGGKAA